MKREAGGCTEIVRKERLLSMIFTEKKSSFGSMVIQVVFFRFTPSYRKLLKNSYFNVATHKVMSSNIFYSIF